MTNILGVNAWHGDSAACLVRDGVLVAAAEEERFRRIKHWAGFPSEAIRYCLAAGKIDMADVDHVAINRNPKTNLPHKLAFMLRHRPDWRYVLDRLRHGQHWASLGEEIARSFSQSPFRGEDHHVEHHLAHIASAFLVSPFDEAVAVSVDGSGDFATAAWGVGRGSKV